MRQHATLLAGLLGAATVSAAPTWPASTDEMEEIQYQLTGMLSRNFADNITPCTKEVHGAGRVTASEWLRTAFHDMSTANNYFGMGGLDASLMYELNDGENIGPGFNTTLQTYAGYFSPRSSMSDLIALGGAMSVRACGGPVVPFKGGRIDATSSGSTGVPQPGDGIGIFINKFSRMGFTQTEMIQLTACGHTLGGTHSADFPALVPAGSVQDGDAPFDTSESAFDNHIVTEYLAGTTKDPLVVGPSVAAQQDSDLVVFSSDKNATMQNLATSATFTNVCATVLQKMIEVVPSGVVLSAVVVPYDIKPVQMQLTLNTDGSLALSGYIRARTTGASVSGIAINYKTRAGAVGATSTFKASTPGASLDETFAFFPISMTIPSATGIASFTVTATFADGTTKLYDNNGASFPMTDGIFMQKPSSCLLQGTGVMNVVAMVRNDLATQPASINVQYQTPQKGIAGPKLSNTTIALTAGKCSGAYTAFSGSYTILGGMSSQARIDFITGSGATAQSDLFKLGSSLGGTCVAYAGNAACGGSTNAGTSTTTSSTSTSTSMSSSTTTSKTSTSTTTSASTSSTATSTSTTSKPATTSSTSTSTSTSSTRSTTSTSSSASASATLAHKLSVGSYSLVGCWTEAPSVRTLSDASYYDDAMTLEMCAAKCQGYTYWGAEYGRECYCGNALAQGSASAPITDCSFTCPGNNLEYCGAGNRLELYKIGSAATSSAAGTTASSASTSVPVKAASTSTTTSTSAAVPSTTSTTSSAAASPTTAIKEYVGKYSFLGCQTEGNGVRTLPSAMTADDAMTLEMCAKFCDAYKYFGVEYGRECWCGNKVDPSSSGAPLTDCSFQCAGDKTEYCGAGNRLDLYWSGP